MCSARQPGFSQCVPGWIPLWYSAWRTGDVDDDILVALAAGGKDDAKPASPGPWGQCGGAKYAGPTKCPNDYACKYRSVTLSQCIPSSIAKWIPDYPHNDEPGDKEKSDDKESKHDSDKACAGPSTSLPPSRSGQQLQQPETHACRVLL